MAPRKQHHATWDCRCHRHCHRPEARARVLLGIWGGTIARVLFACRQYSVRRDVSSPLRRSRRVWTQSSCLAGRWSFFQTSPTFVSSSQHISIFKSKPSHPSSYPQDQNSPTGQQASHSNTSSRRSPAAYAHPAPFPIPKESKTTQPIGRGERTQSFRPSTSTTLTISTNQPVDASHQQAKQADRQAVSAQASQPLPAHSLGTPLACRVHVLYVHRRH